MRGTLLAGLFLLSCSTASGDGSPPAGRPPAEAAAGATARPCEPTAKRDSLGVITVNGLVGLIGSTVTSEATMAEDEPLLLVRRGASLGDQVVLRFDNVGASSPASWVSYGAAASANPNPWSPFAFEFGWKPIAFRGSCWRLIVDGVDTGLVLHVAP